MKVVKIIWIDSCSSDSSWTMAEDVNTGIIQIETYGIIIKETDEFISVAQNYGNEPEQFCNIMTIPKGCIKETVTIPDIVKERSNSDEDERIRKELIAFLKNASEGNLDISTPYKTFGKWLAWLEKQGCEPMEINPTEFDIRLQALIARFGGLPKEELVGSLSFWLNVVQNDGTYKDEEKQGEQKPTSDTMYEVGAGDSLSVNGKPFDYEHASITQKDFAPKDKCAGCNNYKGCVTCVDGDQWAKITKESKFKVGDWVVHNESGFVGQITKIIKSDDGFAYDHTNGYFHGCFEDNYHLWGIEDAKDGDVLTSIGFHSNCTFIFKGLDNWKFDEPNGNKAVATGYCCLSASADKMEFGMQGQDCIEIDTVKPATKIQRDLLFSKMKEAGYTWNPDEKKLEKIEQKSSDSYCREYCKGYQETGKCFADGGCDAKREADNKQWSEEDKRFMYDTLGNLTELKDRYGEGYGNAGKCINWLKSIKDRVQPKQEWSEHKKLIKNDACVALTEKMLYDIILDLKVFRDKDCSAEGKAAYQREIDWLENLKKELGG